MTKQQAMLKIKLARTCGNFEESQQEISRILDQIDQTPGEFTVRELVESLDSGHWTQIYSDQTWYLSANALQTYCEGRGIDSLRDKLLELAKPPMPETLCVELPTSTIVAIAAGRECEVQAACKAALEKAGVKL